MIGRREWVRRTGYGLGAAVVGCGDDATTPLLPEDGGIAFDDGGGAPDAGQDAGIVERRVFVHGVASGDPLPNAVILWTRVSPEADGPVEVAWVLATDPELTDLVDEGSFTTNAERDYTVKVEPSALQPATTYYYRFEALGERSLVGRTRTAPTGAVERARFGVVSCSSLAHGWFHVYRHLADEDLDAVLHLGDYIYEYGDDEYGRERTYEPSHEIVTLSDYRARYAQYRRDRDLQAIHQQHPFVCIWDDHESANNSHRDGAGNHQASEGSWEERKAVAYQAYVEWLPIREQEEGKLWRAFSWGELADLFLLDTRIWGRDAPPAQAEGAEDPTRQILGDDQETWLSEGLTASSATWKLLGQQVMVGHLNAGEAGTFSPFNLDQWDGYQAARTRLFDRIATVENPIVLTGDIHSHWAIELSHDPFDPEVYDAETGMGVVGVELVTSGVTSPAVPDERLGAGLETALRRGNPHMKHINFVKRGWITLDLTPTVAQADFWEVDGVNARAMGDASFRTAFTIASGTPRLVAATTATVARSDAPDLAPETPLREVPTPRS